MKENEVSILRCLRHGERFTWGGVCSQCAWEQRPTAEEMPIDIFDVVPTDIDIQHVDPKCMETEHEAYQEPNMSGLD